MRMSFSTSRVMIKTSIKRRELQLPRQLTPVKERVSLPTRISDRFHAIKHWVPPTNTDIILYAIRMESMTVWAMEYCCLVIMCRHQLPKGFAYQLFIEYHGRSTVSSFPSIQYDVGQSQVVEFEHTLIYSGTRSRSCCTHYVHLTPSSTAIGK